MTSSWDPDPGGQGPEGSGILDLGPSGGRDLHLETPDRSPLYTFPRARNRDHPQTTYGMSILGSGGTLNMTHSEVVGLPHFGYWSRWSRAIHGASRTQDIPFLRPKGIRT